MIDTGILRKRVKAAMDQVRREHAERRGRAAEAARAYDAFLSERAVPAFRAVANVLKAEGVLFEVATPSGGVSLVSERHRDEGIALELDAALDPPAPVATVTRTRGSRSLRSERPVRAGAAIEQLSEEDVIAMLLEEIRPWLA